MEGLTSPMSSELPRNSPTLASLTVPLPSHHHPVGSFTRHSFRPSDPLSSSPFLHPCEAFVGQVERAASFLPPRNQCTVRQVPEPQLQFVRLVIIARLAFEWSW